jgi:hypothetical protein
MSNPADRDNFTSHVSSLDFVLDVGTIHLVGATSMVFEYRP